MWSWLLKLDPDLVFGIGSLVWGVLKGVSQYHSISAAKDAILSNLRKEALRLLSEPTTEDKARELLDQAAGRVLARMKIKRSALVDKIVHAVIEKVLHEMEEKALAANLARAAEDAAAVREAFTPKPGAFPKLNIDITEDKGE